MRNVRAWAYNYLRFTELPKISVDNENVTWPQILSALFQMYEKQPSRALAVIFLECAIIKSTDDMNH